jgi:hypothetical protein
VKASKSRPTGNISGISDHRSSTGATWVLEVLQITCLCWVVFLPVSQPLVLYPALLLLLLTSAGLLVVGGDPSVPRPVLLATAVYYVYVIPAVAAAWLQNNPGAVHQGVLWLGVPALWGTWALTLRGEHVRRTILALVVTGAVSALLVIGVAMQALYGLPEYPGFFVDLQQIWAHMSESGSMELAYLGLSSLVAVSGLAVAAAMLPTSDDWLPPRWLTGTSAGLLFVAGVVSGRRGLMLVTIMVAFVAVVTGLVALLRTRQGRARLPRYVASLALAGLVTLGFAVLPVGYNFKVSVPVVAALPTFGGVKASADASTIVDDSIKTNDAASDDAREEQAGELLDAWRGSPVLGQGIGTTLDSGFQRSADRPWMFEIEPLQALMNVGLLGAAALAAALGLTLASIVSAYRRRTHPAALTAAVAGSAALAVGSFTNPYLQAPAHDWGLFLFVGVAVAVLRERPKPVDVDGDS